MYFRPGNLLKCFRVERESTAVDSRGRQSRNYRKTASVMGVLAEARPEEKERWSRVEHPVTHIITQRGKPRAQIGDRLVHGSRVFYVQSMDNAGELDTVTVYYAQERTGLSC